MPGYKRFDLPNLSPQDLETLFGSDRKIVVIGVIGKSTSLDCNKMAGLQILNVHPSLRPHSPKNGQIQFYYKPNDNKLFVHFETTWDAYIAEQSLLEPRPANAQHYDQSQRLNSSFARILLFAIHICHIVVFVETNETFDRSTTDMFSALKLIRERHVSKFLPKLLKNTVAGTLLGKQGRLCSPRFLFLFENYPNDHAKETDFLIRLEREVEDTIYGLLRELNIITSNRNIGLFSIPANKRYVFYNTHEDLRCDQIVRSLNEVKMLLKKNFGKGCDDELDLLRPYPGFGTILSECEAASGRTLSLNDFADPAYNINNHKFMDLLEEHVEDGFKSSFDDHLTRYKGKLQFTILDGKSWFEVFKLLHKIFVDHSSNPNFETNDPDYKSYLDNFNHIVNPENEFYKQCCDHALREAFLYYNFPARPHYGLDFHNKLIEEAVSIYYNYARGPSNPNHEIELREACEDVWRKGKQQCEEMSLRGFPCILSKHLAKTRSEHCSGINFISSCNCGRIQGRREDPYTLRSANYDYYEFMSKHCHFCCITQKVPFPIFQPSISNFRAAESDAIIGKLRINDLEAYPPFPQAVLSQMTGNSPDFLLSQNTQTNMSLASVDELDKIDIENNKHANIEDYDAKPEPVNELVLHLKESADDTLISRQASTTEYLEGMVHMESPAGLLPLFPSWSLSCIGSSSLYSHNTGLQEHFQKGFLAGSNFLLPWDVQVRLEKPSSWIHDCVRHRKIREVFPIKIFIGFEYECPRGHRFVMSGPDKILRNATGIQRDSGSKVVFSNMPLYTQCPCRLDKMSVAQLMRIHVVTPKAPVNVILDPKVHIGSYIFTLGLPTPPKLTQSAYWVLRLPYIYQGDDLPLVPPVEILDMNTLNYGYLAAGMFGVTETDGD